MKNPSPENQPAIDHILSLYQSQLGKYAERYRNHAWRVYLLALSFHPDATEVDKTKLAVAAAFHDLGIWTHHTFDYLKPSIELARGYLAQNGLETQADEVALLIDNHHKLTPYRHNPWVESFRRADLIDLSLNVFRFGVKGNYLRQLRREYPYLGFHRFILGQIIKNSLLHPLRPLPILKR